MPDPFRTPLVMVAGSTDERFEPQVPRYRDLLVDALKGFAGTLIAGGTEQGVAGIVGAAAARNPAIRAIGYVPAVLTGGATEDPRYTEIRRTRGTRFTAAEPLQAWADVLAAGIEPAAVAVLGIGGGDIAAHEYRVSLALGARVGVVAGSGGAADALTTDRRWRHVVETVPENSSAIAAFFRGPATG